MLADTPRSTFMRVVAVQVAVFCSLNLGIGVTIGPALFLNPSRLPQNVGWLLLGVTGAVAVWRLRRRLRVQSTFVTLVGRSDAGPSA